jgi:prepilin-type N-terminal cleavage/methylation domain-containing protein
MRRHAGFTLIELLLAVFILGVVLTTVYASYIGTFRIINATQDDAAVYSMARTVLDRMVRDLQSMAARQEACMFKTKTDSFGDRQFVRITFRAASHVAFGGQDSAGGISVIEYRVEESEANGEKDENGQKVGYILTRSDDLYRDPDKEETVLGGYPLCSRIESLTYVFIDESGKEYDSWDSGGDIEAQKKRAPVAIAIRLNLLNPANREKPYVFATRVHLPFNRWESI